jgi:hypothetical protein
MAWRSELTPVTPGPFPSVVPQTLEYRFGWQSVIAGEGSLAFTQPRPGVSRAEFTAQTTGMTRTLWKMETRTVEWADLATLRPIRVRQAEWYRSSTSLAAQEFEPGGVWRAKGKGEPPPSFFDDTPADAPRMQELTHVMPKWVPIPDLFDLQTALLWVRSQPLHDGDTLRLTLFQGNAPYLAAVRVMGRGPITVPAGTFPAIQLELTAQDINKAFALAPQKRFKRAIAWLSDDDDRRLLRIETAIFVGRVWVELMRATPERAR